MLQDATILHSISKLRLSWQNSYPVSPVGISDHIISCRKKKKEYAIGYNKTYLTPSVTP